MGMDVYGVAPAAKAGEYFRASIWAWRPIWERMALLCSDLLNEDLLDSMAFNSGAGPRDQETCDKVAERLERWLADDPREKFSWEHDSTTLKVNAEGRFVSDKELAADPTLVTKSPYSVSREELQEFIGFLKNCGGFSVW